MTSAPRLSDPQADELAGIMTDALLGWMVRDAAITRKIYGPWLCRRCGKINPSHVLVCDCPRPGGANE
jgi:hypothetical protein